MFDKTQQEIDIAWEERKRQASPITLSETDLQRLIEERHQQQIQREKDGRETIIATKKRDDEYWNGIRDSCLNGSPEERYARFFVRAIQHGLFDKNTLMNPKVKVDGIVQLLRLHNIQIRDGKEKPSLDEYQMTASLFQFDLFVRKGDIRETRKALFPENMEIHQPSGD